VQGHDTAEIHLVVKLGNVHVSTMTDRPDISRAQKAPGKAFLGKSAGRMMRCPYS
jgi:hypothetical protein